MSGQNHSQSWSYWDYDSNDWKGWKDWSDWNGYGWRSWNSWSKSSGWNGNQAQQPANNTSTSSATQIPSSGISSTATSSSNLQLLAPQASVSGVTLRNQSLNIDTDDDSHSIASLDFSRESFFFTGGSPAFSSGPDTRSWWAARSRFFEKFLN